MDERSLITDAARAMIGMETEAEIGYPVSEHEIARYAYAIDDPNPLWTDPAHGSQSPNGGVVAPPLFYNIPFKADRPLSELREDGLPQGDNQRLVPPLKATRQMAGETEVEFLQPIRPGDVLTRKSRLVDIYERDGRTGRLAFVVSENKYTNQRGEIVVVEKSTLVVR